MVRGGVAGKWDLLGIAKACRDFLLPYNPSDLIVCKETIRRV